MKEGSSTSGTWVRLDCPLFSQRLPSDLAWSLLIVTAAGLFPRFSRVERRFVRRGCASTMGVSYFLGSLRWSALSDLVPGYDTRLAPESP